MSRTGAPPRSGIQLDIGGGQNPQPNFLNMDCRELPEVDVVHSWDDYPWPFADESVLVAMASHVVEHVSPINGNFLRWMDEVWRVLVPDGQLAIATPYAGSPGYWQDPTHVNGCNEATWSYFDPEVAGGHLYRIYRPKPWRIEALSWSVVGNIEVLLRKRREDPSYGL